MLNDYLGVNIMTTADATLLVIDDIEENCQMLKRRLEYCGYKVETAMDGQEGLLMLARRMIDLVLLDLDMPVMNGFTFLEKIKSHQKHSHIPVIITTSLDDPDTAMDCQMFGASGFVAKPYDMEEIFSVVKNCLVNVTA